MPLLSYIKCKRSYNFPRVGPAATRFAPFSIEWVVITKHDNRTPKEYRTIAIPDYQMLMLPVLRLASDKEEHRFRAAIESLADEFYLSDEERNELLPSGSQAVFNNRVGWARTYLKQAGLPESPKRGYFRITERDIVKKAEEEYSHKRLQSLATEWHIVHPNLAPVSQMLYGMKEHFLLSDITRDFLCDRYEEAVHSIDDTNNDPLFIALDKLYTDDGNFNTIRNHLVRTLHFVGLVGIKTGPTSSINWAYESNLSLAPGQIRPNSTVHIHPMFYRALGIKL